MFLSHCHGHSLCVLMLSGIHSALCLGLRLKKKGRHAHIYFCVLGKHAANSTKSATALISHMQNLDFWCHMGTQHSTPLGTPPIWHAHPYLVATTTLFVHSLLGCFGCGWGATAPLGRWGGKLGGGHWGCPPPHVVRCQHQRDLANSPSSCWRSPSSEEAISLALGATGSGALGPHHTPQACSCGWPPPHTLPCGPWPCQSWEPLATLGPLLGPPRAPLSKPMVAGGGAANKQFRGTMTQLEGRCF